MGGDILDFSLLMSTTVDGMELSLGEHRSYGCMCETRVHSLSTRNTQLYSDAFGDAVVARLTLHVGHVMIEEPEAGVKLLGG